MPEAFWEMLPFLAAGVGVAVLGAVLPAFWCPGPHARAHIQHFAAGIVTAAVSVEILPEIIAEPEAEPVSVLAAFVFGGLFMLGLKWFDHWFERREAARGALGIGLALAAALDTLVDGVMVAAGFVAGAHAGPLLAVGLGLEVLFLALSVGAELRNEGVPRGKAVMITLPIPAALAVGALVGVMVLGGVSATVFSMVLAFGAAALIYLVVEELVLYSGPAGHDLQTTAGFFAGFLVIFAFRLLGAH